MTGRGQRTPEELKMKGENDEWAKSTLVFTATRKFRSVVCAVFSNVMTIFLSFFNT
jgi:hypothetical protein